MKMSKKIFILSIFIILISVIGVYAVSDYQNSNDIPINLKNNNETDPFGCCSLVLQEDGNSSILSYRRDSNLNADIHIEQIDWHGKSAIKQYKTDNKYFCHVIITSDGWVIGLGGIDDGSDNEKCENITSEMITDNNTISEASLKKIQDIKKPYGRGHVLVKAPNGNYGFANVDKLKTGKLEPGQYISIPNDYSYSRSGNLSLDTPDIIKSMTDLSQQDLYGLDRREIITYDLNVTGSENNVNVYVANENGSYVGIDNTVYIDDIYINNNVIKGKDIPIAPAYKEIGSFSLTKDSSSSGKLPVLIYIVLFVIFVAILFFVVFRFVKYIRYRR